ncbi:hypothetical protein F5Y15DRAFT_426299 [Xylariaceae sp. FL0016]|nr:hypothetical protein F5Y15DRAFT_426299 [Xylariaceae sp. FL0016]
MASLTERYEALIQWVRETGGNLHSAVEIYHDQQTGGSLRVKDSASVQADEVAVSLPLSASISYLNAISGHPDFPAATPSSIAHSKGGAHLPASFLKETPPHVIGRFFLIQQYLLGQESRWWPYIRMLPQPSQMSSMLPVMWPSDDVEFLAGTNAYVAVEEIRSMLKKEYKRAMKLLPEGSKFEYTRPLYYWAYCIFTSRSFRPSLIIPSSEMASLPCQVDDFSVLLPLFDIGNHSPLVETRWTTEEREQVCKLHCGKAYSAGEQIYNNYGMKTNAELLLGYGFVFPENADFHNDYVHIKTKANPEAGDLAASHIVSLRSFAHPSSVIGRSRLLGPDHLVDVLHCFSHIQDSLIAALFESMAQEGNDGPDVSLVEIMQGKISDVMLERIVNALGSKLSMDLETIEAQDPEYEPANSNQQVAFTYREQCKKVLGNTLLSLSATKPSASS